MKNKNSIEKTIKKIYEEMNTKFNESYTPEFVELENTSRKEEISYGDLYLVRAFFKEGIEFEIDYYFHENTPIPVENACGGVLFPVELEHKNIHPAIKGIATHEYLHNVKENEKISWEENFKKRLVQTPFRIFDLDEECQIERITHTFLSEEECKKLKNFREYELNFWKSILELSKKYGTHFIEEYGKVFTDLEKFYKYRKYLEICEELENGNIKANVKKWIHVNYLKKGIGEIQSILRGRCLILEKGYLCKS